MEVVLSDEVNFYDEPVIVVKKEYNEEENTKPKKAIPSKKAKVGRRFVKKEIKKEDCGEGNGLEQLHHALDRAKVYSNFLASQTVEIARMNKHCIIEQPALFTGGTLRSYQLEGYEWLLRMFENSSSGILADEMGLGKTIQCIALFAHFFECNVPGPFLVCAPLTTLTNWMDEFAKFAPKVPVRLYHSTVPDLREKLRGNIMKPVKFGRSKLVAPVIITSYDIVLRDHIFFQSIEWRYVIVDEGHRLKNANCKLMGELKDITTDGRLVLTGTPLQNNISELWSLLNFLMPKIFKQDQAFESWFDVRDELEERLLHGEQERQIVSKLHSILEPFVLRRLKCDVEIMLPPKRENLVYAPLSQKQFQFYKAIANKTVFMLLEDARNARPTHTRSRACSIKAKIKISVASQKRKNSDIIDEGVLQRLANEIKEEVHEPSYDPAEVNIKLNHITSQLQKCCDHPYLLEYPLDPETGDHRIDEEIVSSSGKMMIVDALLQNLKERDHKVLIFSQMTRMLDVLEDYVSWRNWDYCRLDGSMSLDRRKNEIERFSENSEVFVFLLSTRAGGTGLNLTAADTVIMYDSDWNPQNDLQAMDRCHRIGQTRPVVVYRLVTANTIDQRIFERAGKKRQLEKVILQSSKKIKVNESTEKLGFGKIDLLRLLRKKDYEKVVQISNQVFTNEQMERLLDRSTMIPGSSDCDVKVKPEFKVNRKMLA